MAISILRSLKFGFYESCHKFRPLQALTRPLYAAAKQEGTAHGYPTIGIVGAGQIGQRHRPCYGSGQAMTLLFELT